MTFTGFPEAALDFYDDLEMDTTKSFWAAHKDVYESAVRAPMLALMAELEDQFGPAKVFRPYRDVRYAQDKTPYKTHQGGFVQVAESTGWYVQVDARGVRISAGTYRTEGPGRTAFREAVDSPRGAHLERILAPLAAAGWQLQGDQLKTRPRGYELDHPRIELLRRTALSVGRDYGFEPVVHSAELVERVRADWEEARPLVDWMADTLRA